jgi:hypothetical protein
MYAGENSHYTPADDVNIEEMHNDETCGLTHKRMA